MDELRRQQAVLASGRGIPGLGPNAVPTAPPSEQQWAPASLFGKVAGLGPQAAGSQQRSHCRRESAAECSATGQELPSCTNNTFTSLLCLPPAAKRPRPDKQPLTVAQALGQIPADKNPLMVRRLA